MNRLVEGLLETATSQEANIRDEARLQIAMLLEKHSSLANSARFYQDLLPREMASLVLTKVEVDELLARVGELVMVRQLPSDIVSWGLTTDALSKALETLLCFVSTYGHELDEKTISDALNGIDRCLAPIDQRLETNLSDLVSKNNPTPFLLKVIASQSSNKEIARAVLNKVSEFLRKTEDANR